jgi:hypothetical protein
MARRLAYTVHVPVYGETEAGDKYLERTEMFLRGTELPEWAVPLVGDHVYEPGEAPSASPAPVELVEDTEPDPEPDPEPEKPAGNASADVWRAYAVALGADPEDVADLSRNELRDQYGK